MEEKKNREKNNKEVVTVFLVLLLVIVIIGVSYAAFTFSKAGTVENAITTGAVTMIYTEGDNQITINNAMPITEEAGKTLSDENHLFDFTININIVGNTTISYEVTAEKDPSSTLANSEVRLYLQKSLDGTNYNEEVLDPSPYEPLDEDDEFGAKAGEMVLDVGSTNKTVMYYYRLRMWVDSSYELGEVAKTFTIKVNAYGKDGKYTLQRPKNRNIKKIYVYNQESEATNYCVTGEEETCEKSNCFQNESMNSCPTGTIIRYAVNNKEEKYFYVLHDDGKTMTLQQRENTLYNVPWYAAGEDSSKGPITVLPELEKITASWKNVNDQTYTMGTTLFQGNYYTACHPSSRDCVVNGYTLPERTAKARMITVQEAKAIGCISYATCPLWMYNYLENSIFYGGTINDIGEGRNDGYWMMNTNRNNQRNVWMVSPSVGLEAYAGPYSLTTGTRAVVVINK